MYARCFVGIPVLYQYSVFYPVHLAFMISIFLILELCEISIVHREWIGRSALGGGLTAAAAAAVRGPQLRLPPLVAVITRVAHIEI